LEQIDLFRMTVQTLERLGIRYMVVGSFASSTYGEPRMTRDIDIVIDVHGDQIERLCDAFPPDEFYVSQDAARMAVLQHGQFNIVHPDSGNKIDFMIARTDPWGREQLDRRQAVLFPDTGTWYAARPEDVILSKMIYFQEGGSDKHLRDIAGMLKVSGSVIDRAYLARWVERFGLQEIWQSILRQLDGSGKVP
jgi:hypothetical protein